jgi:YHS domain-containing protein
MAILIRLILFLFGFYLVKRFVANLIRSNKTRSPEMNNPPDSSTQMVKDPVCGMYMDSRLALRVENREGTHYFCSEGCKIKFLNVSSGTNAGSAVSG